MTLVNTVDSNIDQSIIVDKESEFFIAIAKKDVHSFIMLGVVVDGKPKLLAKVGKGNIIDKSFGTSCTQQFTLFGKMLRGHSDALLIDEGIGSSNQFPVISYQAYAISFEQYLEFLAITKDIHQDQLELYKDRANPVGEDKKLTYPERAVLKLRKGIYCYLPDEEISPGKIALTYQEIGAFKKEGIHDDKLIRQDIIDEAKEINTYNTCRTTARSILNYTLHYTANVPALFALGFDYKTILLNGNTLPSNTFYILPQPPNCFQVNSTQMKVLEELYQKLEDIPKKEPESDVTRRKFKNLKKLYLEIAVEPQLSLSLLLDKITVHRANHQKLLDTRRGQSCISRFAELLGIKIQTGTQQAYDRMEQTISKEIERVKKINISSLPSQNMGNTDRGPFTPSAG